MPGFTTHYIIGVKAYNELPSCKLKRIIAQNRQLFQLGLQGPDIFFYNLPIIRHRDYRNVGSYMHEHNVQEFFENYLKHLAELTSTYQVEQALAYFCGFLCHYIADSICHPYVYGRIEYNVRRPSNYYHGRHAALENDIDAILLKIYKGKKPSEFNQSTTICLNPQESQFIAQFLSSCINETYYKVDYRNSFQVSARSVRLSIISIRFGCRTLADPNGKKKSKVEFFEGIFLKNPIVSTKLVTDQIENRKWSLNTAHDVWKNPWNKRIVSRASFPDLFNQCLARCDQVFNQINADISNSIPWSDKDFRKLLALLGNLSYHSGLPAS